jgi:hypothetical protein
VDASPDLKAERLDSVGNGPRTADRASRSIEARKKTVACRIDFATSMTLELLSNCKMMLAKEILPSPIPDLRGLFGRVNNIREQDGGKNPVRLGPAARPC